MSTGALRSNEVAKPEFKGMKAKREEYDWFATNRWVGGLSGRFHNNTRAGRENT